MTAEDGEGGLEDPAAALPTDRYIGLTAVQAEAAAAGEGRYIEDRTHATWDTIEYGFGRVKVWVDSSGRVVRAEAG